MVTMVEKSMQKNQAFGNPVRSKASMERDKEVEGKREIVIIEGKLGFGMRLGMV